MTGVLAVVAACVLTAAIAVLLWDELRRPPEPTKRAVNQRRLARLHVVDRPAVVERHADGSPRLERMPAGYRSPPDPESGEEGEPLLPGDRLLDGFWTKPDGRVWTGRDWVPGADPFDVSPDLVEWRETVRTRREPSPDPEDAA